MEEEMHQAGPILNYTSKSIMTHLSFEDTLLSACEDPPFVDLYPTSRSATGTSQSLHTTIPHAVTTTASVLPPQDVILSDVMPRSARSPDSPYKVGHRHGQHQPLQHSSCALCAVQQSTPGPICQSGSTVVFNLARLRSIQHFRMFTFLKYMDFHCDNLITDVVYVYLQCRCSIALKSLHHTAAYLVSTLNSFLNTKNLH